MLNAPSREFYRLEQSRLKSKKMSNPIASISNLVLTVGKLLYEEGVYLDAVAEKLERLLTELVWMKCFLKDAAAARRSKQEVVNAWVAEVRKNAYDAEDFIDMFDVEIQCSKRSSCIGRSCSNFKQASRLHQMGNRIDGLVRRISDLNRRAQTYGINPHGAETSAAPRRETFPDDPEVIERDGLVGFDTYLEQLESVLLDNLENRRYDVVTISGMGGLGKTTLARKMYHNKEIQRDFSSFAWVSISKQFQTKEIWQNILLQLESRKDEERKKEIRGLTEMELTQQLPQLLQVNRCLVVLDDLWENQDWYLLKKALISPTISSSSTKTKILITSRNRGVAEDIRNRYLLTPACLDENPSWELLEKIVFPPPIQNHAGTEGEIATEISNKKKGLAKNMIKHCGGLPLAIRVLGGLLKAKVTLDEWETVNERITTQIARGGGSGGQVNKGVRNILASSYDDLPPHLKSCFVYMAQFPEDHEIDVNNLVEMWMAEGMVEVMAVHWEEEQDDLEDVGESYLQELVRRSMVLPGKRNDLDNTVLETCRLHDLMRDLCLSKAREENMLEIMNRKSKSVIGSNVWRLAVHDEVKLKDLHPNPNLRSLWFFCDFFSEEEPRGDDAGFISKLAFSWKVYHESRKLWAFVSKEYKMLRVLNLEGVVLRRSPYEIGELTYLKMLVFGDVVGTKLPSSIGKLRRLQTLNLYELRSFYQIPKVIWKLVELTHLYLPLGHRGTIKMGRWKNLRKLINIRFMDVNDIESLGEMTQLKVLDIFQAFLQNFSKEMIDALNRALINLRLLRSLKIYYRGTFEERPPIAAPLQLGCSSICKLVLNMRFSSWLGEDNQIIFPVTLAHLELQNSELQQDPMPILEKLPNLQRLKLGGNCFLGEEMVCSNGGFPNLHSLQVVGVRGLERMIIGAGAMSKLKRMAIKGCDRWGSFPDTLSSIKSLEEMHLGCLTPNFWRERVVMGGVDHDKLKHIPFITIDSSLN